MEEKAQNDVFNIRLQMLDDGRLTDGQEAVYGARQLKSAVPRYLPDRLAALVLCGAMKEGSAV